MRAKSLKEINDNVRRISAERQKIHDLFNRSCRMEEVYPDAFVNGQARMGVITGMDKYPSREQVVIGAYFLDEHDEKIHEISADDYHYIMTGERK